MGRLLAGVDPTLVITLPTAAKLLVRVNVITRTEKAFYVPWVLF